MKQAVYLLKDTFCFDLQKCLSPVPVASNEVLQARTLNGAAYPSLRTALEKEFNKLRNQMISGVVFKGNVAKTEELAINYTGSAGDYFYCVNDGYYYAWTGSEWSVFGDTAKIADGSITYQKTAFITGGENPNLIYDNEVLRGALLNNDGSYDAQEGFDTLIHGIAVEGGKTYCFSLNGQGVWISKVVFKTADDLQNFDVSTLVSYQTNVYTYITVPTNAKFMFVSMSTSDGDVATLVIQEGDTPMPVSKSPTLSSKIKVPHCVSSNLHGLTMMTLGDSLSEEGRWQEYVQEYTGLKKIVNMAVGGQKISAFANGVTQETLADVDIVFVMGLFNSTSSLPGTTADQASGAEDASVCAGYKYIVEKIYSLNPSVKIVLASPHRPQANDVAEKAAAVGMVAAYYGIPFIDLYNSAGFNNFTYPIYLRDSVHSSYGVGGGYEREAQTIAGGLIKFFG